MGKLEQKTGKTGRFPVDYGENFLTSLDGRTQVARELKARLDALQSDLGGEATGMFLSRTRRGWTSSAGR